MICLKIKEFIEKGGQVRRLRYFKCSFYGWINGKCYRVTGVKKIKELRKISPVSTTYPLPHSTQTLVFGFKVGLGEALSRGGESRH